MKKLITISALSVLIVLGSCKKFLTEKPLAQVALEQFYKNKYDVDAAVAGMYSAFQLTMVGNSQYTENYLYWGEYRSDNFDRAISYTKDYTDEIALNSLTPTNDFSDWTGLYNVIGKSNNNIKYIPKATALDPQLTPEISNSYMAQAYAMRAMSYFYIVRVWGDAPIWLEPYEDLKSPAARPRESKDKIITEIIVPDLEKAYGMIKKGDKANIFYINEGAICATLADVYMWKKDYPNAIKWIQNLFKAKSATNTLYAGIDDGNLQPSASWKSIFTNPTTSKETIWSIHWDYVKNGCACMQTSWTANNKQIIVDEDIFSSWFAVQTSPTPSPDIRPKQTLDVYPATGNKRDRLVKWYPTAANPIAADPWPATNQTLPVYLTMYRLSDMYLLYAEALNGTNNPTAALKYLNFVRKRAGVAEYLPVDPLVTGKEALEDAILNERQKELFGEGKRWFDLVRTDHVKEVMDPILKRRQIAAGNLDAPGFIDPTNRVLWPINRNVLNSNTQLVQNAGYTD